MLSSRFLSSFALCLSFFSDEFFQYVAFRGHSFMTSTKNREREGVGGTQFWPILLMAVHCFWGRGFSFRDI